MWSIDYWELQTQRVNRRGCTWFGPGRVGSVLHHGRHALVSGDFHVINDIALLQLQ